MCLDLEQIHLFIKYEGSMINHKCRRAKYWKIDKWMQFQKCMLHWLNFLRAYARAHVHMHARHEVSVIKLVTRTVYNVNANKCQ